MMLILLCSDVVLVAVSCIEAAWRQLFLLRRPCCGLALYALVWHMENSAYVRTLRVFFAVGVYFLCGSYCTSVPVECIFS